MLPNSWAKLSTSRGPDVAVRGLPLLGGTTGPRRGAIVRPIFFFCFNRRLTLDLVGERPYDPRPYDARYARDRPDDRRGGRYDDGKDRGRYDRYDERERGYGRDRDYDRGGYGGGRDRYDDRRGDDRRY